MWKVVVHFAFDDLQSFPLTPFGVWVQLSSARASSSDLYRSEGLRVENRPIADNLALHKFRRCVLLTLSQKD